MSHDFIESRQKKSRMGQVTLAVTILTFLSPVIYFFKDSPTEYVHLFIVFVGCVVLLFIPLFIAFFYMRNQHLYIGIYLVVLSSTLFLISVWYSLSFGVDIDIFALIISPLALLCISGILNITVWWKERDYRL